MLRWEPVFCRINAEVQSTPDNNHLVFAASFFNVFQAQDHETVGRYTVYDTGRTMVS
jgi:hypothetical protein